MITRAKCDYCGEELEQRTLDAGTKYVCEVCGYPYYDEGGYP